jgi:hypothetical protein
MAAAPPIQPDFGQTLTKGVKYLKINKIDKDGEDFGSQLNAADNLILNYPDIGPTQYNILTTQEQDGCYLMGVIPVENTSSLNNVKNLDLNLFKSPVSKTLNQLEVAVWNPDNDGGLFVAGGNGGGYYDDATDLLDFNLANTPTSVTSSITVSSIVGSPIYLSVLIPEGSVDAWVEGIPINLWENYGIQLLNVINITGAGTQTISAQSSLNDNFGGRYYFGGVNFSLFGGSFTIIQVTEEINQSTIQPPQVSNPILININPEVEEFDWSNYNAVFGNVDTPQYSQTFMQIDYNTGGTIPTNFGLLYSGSAPKAFIQDSNYTQMGWSNGRYDGSQNSSTDFNIYNK